VWQARRALVLMSGSGSPPDLIGAGANEGLLNSVASGIAKKSVVLTLGIGLR
jgi:hypothetical protein